LDHVLGRTNPAQIVSVGAAYILGAGAYFLAGRAMRMEEARDIIGVILRRLNRGRSSDGGTTGGGTGGGGTTGALPEGGDSA
jgi:hypothetical protein